MKKIFLGLGKLLALILLFGVVNIAGLMLSVWNIQDAEVIFNGKVVTIAVWNIMKNKELASVLHFWHIDKVGQIFLYLGTAAGLFFSGKIVSWYVKGKIEFSQQLKLSKAQSKLSDINKKIMK